MLSCNSRLPGYSNKVKLEFFNKLFFQGRGLSGLNGFENSLTKFAYNQKKETPITNPKLREMPSNNFIIDNQMKNITQFS